MAATDGALWRRHLVASENDRVDTLLDPADRDRLTQLVTAPRDHIDALRDDLAFQVAVARADVLPRLLGWFGPQPGRGHEGWEHDPGRSGPVGPASACVVWSFAGTYASGAEANTSFNGVLAVGQPVELHGVTFMGLDGAPDGPAAFRLRRFVDWAGLYTQLGLTLGGRVPHDAGRRPRH